MTMKTNLAITIGVILLLVTASCKPDHQQEVLVTSDPKSVVVQQLKPVLEPLPIEVSGIISSKIETRLSFKLAGVIQRIAVEEGQRVKKGQLLANLNLSEINAQVIQAQNAVDKAERDLSRIKNLYQDSVATLEQLQDLKTVLEVSQADLKIAKFNRQYARIVSPTDGKVLKRYQEQGELVPAGTPVLTVGSHGQDAYIMRVALADRDIVKLVYRDTASIQFDAFPGHTFKAYVSELAEAANPATGTFEIELTLDPENHPLKSGFIGKATIYPSVQEPYLKISLSALIEGNRQKARVFFYDDNTGQATLTEIQPIHIGNTFFTVAVSDAIDLNHVITDGGAYINDGEIVQPI